ncbi:FAD-dependent oxidoreductase [Agrobacterium rhizogenes]|nr:FAD-dependent oxidoreductase [Rhizobium rhizogenes]
MTRLTATNRIIGDALTYKPLLGLVNEVVRHRDVGNYDLSCPLYSIKVEHASQVQKLLERVGKEPIPPKIKVVSTGYNWGLGSSQASYSPFMVLDCSGIKTLRQLDDETLEVGPGVTQYEVASSVVGSRFVPNLTASAPDTSYLGNALARGVGVRGQKSADIVSMRVVLPSGEMIDTDNRSTNKRFSTPGYGEGIGPNLKDLFFQSNLGVVVSANVRLWPKRELEIFRLLFDESQFRDGVRWLEKRLFDRTLTPVVKVFSPTSRRLQAGNAQGSYTCYATVEGPRYSQLRYFEEVLHDANKSGHFTDATRLTHSPNLTPLEKALLGAWNGKPGHSLEMFASMFNLASKDIDAQSPLAWRMVLPILPLDGKGLIEIADLIESIAAKYQLDIGFTLNVMSTNCVDMVICMRFQRDAASEKRANSASEELTTLLERAGVAPYRLDAGTTTWPATRDRISLAMEQAKLKLLFDPRAILL